MATKKKASYSNATKLSKADVRKMGLTPDSRNVRSKEDRAGVRKRKATSAAKSALKRAMTSPFKEARRNAELNARGRATQRRMTETPMKPGKRRPTK